MALADRLFISVLCGLFQLVSCFGHFRGSDHFRCGLERMHKDLIVLQISVFKIPVRRLYLSGCFAGILKQKFLIKFHIVLTVQKTGFSIDPERFERTHPVIRRSYRAECSCDPGSFFRIFRTFLTVGFFRGLGRPFSESRCGPFGSRCGVSGSRCGAFGTFRTCDPFHAKSRRGCLFICGGNFYREPGLRQYFFQHSFKFCDHDGFCQESVKSLPQEHFICRAHRISREGDDRHVLFVLAKDGPYALHGFHSVHARHHMIHKDEICLMVPDIIDCFRSGEYRVDFHAVSREDLSRHEKIHTLVIDHESTYASCEQLSFRLTLL